MPPILPRAIALLALLVLPCLALTAEDGKKVALVVGINRYESRIFPALSYAGNDAVELAKVLRSLSCRFDRVTLLTDADRPTADRLRKAIDAALDGLTSRDTLLIALAGHGLVVEVEGPRRGDRPRRFPFFAASNGTLEGVNEQTGESPTLLNLDHLFARLGRSRAGVKLVLLDACRNQLRMMDRMGSLADTRVTVPDGVQALLGCGRGQFAFESEEWRHGMFFYHVLKGLRGEAVNRRGVVTWASLADYATFEVAEQARKRIGKTQTPTSVSYFEGPSPVLSAPPPSRKEKPAITNTIGMKLVPIPGGTFTMGSPLADRERYRDEAPREVSVSPFSLGAFEVTQKQFRTVMGYNPSFFSRDGNRRPREKYVVEPGGGKALLGKEDDPDAFPVENVTWHEAREFCERLSALPGEKKEGRFYRLPTEAEWEHACRAGAGSYARFHVGDTLSARDANFGNLRKRPCAVGSYPPNAWGLYDMHGNVWEWTSDRYETSAERVFRGGSWFYEARLCRSAYRCMNVPTWRNNGLGLRVALSP